MSKSQETWNKKEKEKLKQKKKQEKALRKEERKSQAGDGSLESMIAYVDEYGNITSTPPDNTKPRKQIDVESIKIGVSRRSAEEEQADNSRTGTVTFFNTSKGFGFIKDSQNGDSIFTHINGHIDSIKENDKVSFKVEQGQKGLNAVEVKLVK